MSLSDSKDLLGQLRTVHFTLLAVCLAAVVIVSSPSPTKIKKAADQLDRIVVVTDSNHWKANFVQVTAERLAREHAECTDQAVHAPLYMKVGNKRFKAVITRRWDVEYNVGDLNISFGGTAPPSVSAPQTLKQFKAFWDSSAKLFCPPFPTKDFSLHTGDQVLVWDTRSNNFLYLPTQHVELFTQSQSEELQLNPKEFVWVVTKHLAEGPDQGIENRPQTALIQVCDDPQKWAIPTNLDKKNFGDIQVKSQVIEAFPDYKWQPVSFKDAFSELNSVATDQQAFDLTLDNLKENLHSQKNAATNAFEAFGIRFPIEATTRWAVFLILSIQGYFWLHLNEYSKRNFPKEDIAWIGIYAGRSAKFVSALTILVVPVLVILLLCITQGLVPLEHKANIILCSLACVLSAFLAWLTAHTQRRIRSGSEKPT